jgi:hypothetical protein
MKHVGIARSRIFRSLIVAISLSAAGVAVADGHLNVESKLVGLPHRLQDSLQLHDRMRALMEDHIVFTRCFIISVAHDLPDGGPTAERLLSNQVDIGNTFATYYGSAVGNQLTELLQEHILIAADILIAAHGGDGPAAEAAIAEWYVNGNEIADFLNSINPRNWRRTETREMLKKHLDTTLASAVARLSGDFEADIEAYDEVHHHMLEMGDFLSNGIIRQFPRRF